MSEEQDAAAHSVNERERANPGPALFGAVLMVVAGSKVGTIAKLLRRLWVGIGMGSDQCVDKPKCLDLNTLEFGFFLTLVGLAIGTLIVRRSEREGDWSRMALVGFSAGAVASVVDLLGLAADRDFEHWGFLFGNLFFAVVCSLVFIVPTYWFASSRTDKGLERHFVRALFWALVLGAGALATQRIILGFVYLLQHHCAATWTMSLVRDAQLRGIDRFGYRPDTLTMIALPIVVILRWGIGEPNHPITVRRKMGLVLVLVVLAGGYGVLEGPSEIHPSLLVPAYALVSLAAMITNLWEVGQNKTMPFVVVRMAAAAIIVAGIAGLFLGLSLPWKDEAWLEGLLAFGMTGALVQAFEPVARRFAGKRQPT